MPPCLAGQGGGRELSAQCVAADTQNVNKAIEAATKFAASL
jgi:hypothetical protein